MICRKIPFLNLFIYIQILFCLLAITFAAHPMLYFNSNDIARLRHKAKTTHAKIAKIIEETGRSLKDEPKQYLPPESFEEFGSRWNELYGNNLCAFAMYCVLYPDDMRALRLVKVYMNRMASYPDWYVSSSRNLDEVPIGHSLTGFATAFDFLYDTFSESERKLYLEKIQIETKHLYTLIVKKKGGWTKQHIHNHAPTNLLATLLGAMVYEEHFPEVALPWKKASIELFEKAMFLFSYVIDGSCDEGVAYGSYTSRGITQYVFLALKHFGIDHTKNRWLREHFWFFFATTMPGYQRSVGIADSNHNWFYGPESQLVFLDAFVMKNGYGNWLADRIRNAKPKNPPLARAGSQKWSTIHTEFIFYDASIKSVKPVLPSNSSMHFFSDWGVVTYGGGQYLRKGNTFLSFKSGALNGEAVSDIVDYKLLSKFIRGWENFNAGHEHPDQNSFVFAPNGRYFITEALYSDKLTHLNNVLLFAPSNSLCNQPWEGQAGECFKWLKYKDYSPVPRGEIITASLTDGIVHIAGEAVKAYRSELELQSVQRSLLLLHPEVLLLVDTVILNPESKLSRASANFHNILHPFHPYRHAGFQGAQVIYPEGPYAFFWLQPDGKSPSALLQNKENQAESKPRKTNFVNVTFNLLKDQPSRIAFVFVGPNVRVPKVEFLKEPDNADVATRMRVVVNEMEYKIILASTSAPLAQRIKALGFGGYAKVQTVDGSVSLGMDTAPGNLNRCDFKDNIDVQNFVRTLVTSTNLSLTEKEIVEEDVPVISSTTYTILSVMLLTVFGLFCFKVFRQRVSKRWKFVLSVMFLWMVYEFLSECWDCGETSFTPTCTIENPIETFNRFSLPTIVIVSLPQSGSEVLRHVFENSSDFLYLPHQDASIPIAGDDPMKYDPCYWFDNSAFAAPAGWFRTTSTEPLLFLNNHPTNPRIEILRRKFRGSGKSARFVLDLSSGFWNTKLPWLRSAIGDSTRTIVVVRDPRSWIYSLLRNDLSVEQAEKQEALQNRLLVDPKCHPPAFLLNEFHETKATNKLERLAEVWNAVVLTMIRHGRQLQIVRYEDFVVNPQHAATSMMRRMGLTIALPQINRLIRTVKSGRFALPYEPKDFISDASVEKWKEKLVKIDIESIERICGDTMKMLGYL